MGKKDKAHGVEAEGTGRVGPGDSETTTYKNMGFCGFAVGANASCVDVKNGRIVRVRPLHFDEKYKPEEMKPWKIKARGKTFEPTMKSLLPPSASHTRRGRIRQTGYSTRSSASIGIRTASVIPRTGGKANSYGYRGTRPLR